MKQNKPLFVNPLLAALLHLWIRFYLQPSLWLKIANIDSVETFAASPNKWFKDVCSVYVPMHLSCWCSGYFSLFVSRYQHFPFASLQQILHSQSVHPVTRKSLKIYHHEEIKQNMSREEKLYIVLIHFFDYIFKKNIGHPMFHARLLQLINGDVTTSVFIKVLKRRHKMLFSV